MNDFTPLQRPTIRVRLDPESKAILAVVDNTAGDTGIPKKNAPFDDTLDLATPDWYPTAS